jgi:predicted pyridoxine 5'-phosphate oxidase superfamily flavin-nucleotide-binding protein
VTTVADFYSPQSRELQDRFDTRRLADRARQVVVHERVTPDDKRFIESLAMFFIATVDAEGHPQCSYKGGAPGFVRVLDERNIAFPLYDGNGMYLTAGNVLASSEVGLLFIDFASPRRLRLNGSAAVDADDPLLADYHEAQLMVRIEVREIYVNCPRYVHRAVWVEDSPFVPQQGCETPIPDWKRKDTMLDVLSTRDRERLEQERGAS